MTSVVKKNKSTSQKNNNDNVITDEQMINKVLENIGKKVKMIIKKL